MQLKGNTLSLSLIVVAAAAVVTIFSQILSLDGHILAHILAATSIGVISATAFHYYHRQKPPKQLEDQTIVPLLNRNESGCVVKLERFSNYVARQIGFEDGSECPQLCKLAYEYLKKSKECESTIYEYFADEPNVDELYVKLVEEFDKCILAYFAFHWSQASLMISQYTAFDQLKRRLLKRQLSKKRGTKPSSEALSAFSAFVLGEVSKCIATCLTYPAIRWIFYSVFMKNWCKVTIQAKSDEDEIKEDQPKAQKTVSGAIHTIWKREWLLGFFKGLRAQILKTLLSLALLMMVKEKVTKTTWVLMLALQRYLSITKTRLKNA